MRARSVISMLLAAAMAGAGAAGAAPAEKRQPVLLVSKGNLPNDTNPDGIALALEDRPEMGGAVLKVPLPADGSFGQSRVTLDWTGYKTLQFTAYNPGQKELDLALDIKHAKSTNFATRIEVPVVLRPGKNTLTYDLTTLANTDGSRPELSAIKQWYIYSPGAPATFYMGDIWLVGEGTPASALAAPAADTTPLVAMPAGPQGIRIAGKIGDLPIDLTITGISLAGGETAPAPGGLAPMAGRSTAGGEDIRPLLRVSRGEMPNDSSPDEVLGTLAAEQKPELGGTALKVPFTAGASFGQSRVSQNWVGYKAFKFTALNPGQVPVEIILTVRHKNTTGFQTRVDAPIQLKPGKNEISVGLAPLKNVDGSAPDLSAVRQWYLCCNTACTLYFGDFVLSK